MLKMAVFSQVRLSAYHRPMVMYIKADDPDLPAFFFDQLIHPIPAYASGGGDGSAAMAVDGAVDGEAEEEWTLPAGVVPLLEEEELYTEHTAAVRCCTFVDASESQQLFTQRSCGGLMRWCSASFTSACEYLMRSPQPQCATLVLHIARHVCCAQGIALLWAPHPFNRRSGRTRRVLDVPLVNSWFQEHVPAGCDSCYSLCLAVAYL
jgi:pre-mRNA-processing factor 8